MSQEIFHAIAEPNRRRLLELVRERERCVGDLVQRVGLTPGAVSQHLKVLADARLVTRRREGRFRYYRADARGLREVDEWVARFRAFWDGRLERLERLLEKRR